MSEVINLNRLAYFSAVVEAGSFTRAAERLGVTKTVVSQQVSRLEQETGTSLLVRTTRRVEATEAGRMLYSRCVLIFREADDAFSELAQAGAEPRGTLRITAPNDYGASVVSPVAAHFTARYPDCRVELVLSDQKLDLIEHHIDLSVRVGWLEDSSLQAKRIGTFRQYLVAIPDIGARAAGIEPEALATFPFVANTALREPGLWHFSRGDLERRIVRLQPRLSVNTSPAARSATLAGAGVSVLPDFHVANDLGSGRLVRLLPDWDLPSGGIFAVYPAVRFRQPKVTAFVAMLIDEARSSVT